MPDPIITALAKPATKAFADAVRKLAKANDVAAEAEFQQALESMVLEMYPSWRDAQTDELPTADDVIGAARDLEHEYKQARSNRKRELLNRAFLGRFNPRLYREGMTELLWEYARQLEYPQARLLAELVAEVRDQLAKNSPTTQFMPDERPSVRFTAREVQLEKSDIRFELARRLASQGLVEVEEHASVVNVAPVLGIAEQLRVFIWGDGELPGAE